MNEVISLDSSFIRTRISELRVKKGVSEYKMSLDLGHSKGYIQGISSGKAFPSVPELFYICEYLGVTLQEFFSTEIHDPQLVNELYTLAKGLDAEDLQVLIDTAKRLSK